MDLEILEGHSMTDAEMTEIKAEFHPSNIINVNILFPVGAILPMSGNLAPDGFLPCDGRVVNITDYPNLANYYETAQGSKNFYGGDGTTTFGVPDLRGEFLRGTGTNSHSNQGNGANVGVHQNATEIPEFGISNSEGMVYIKQQGAENNSIGKSDGSVNGSSISYFKVSKASSASTSTTSYKQTVRPTNTSVLYCVKY